LEPQVILLAYIYKLAAIKRKEGRRTLGEGSLNLLQTLHQFLVAIGVGAVARGILWEKV
jgi:hypothetical protein